MFKERELSFKSMEEFKEEIEFFAENWVIKQGLKRVLVWVEDDNINVGSMFSENGVVELHYITIKRG